jgi:hypothetical protein
MTHSMPAITLWGPWAQFVALRLKSIETRWHDRFKSLVGKRIAIHAGKSFVREDLDEAIAEFGLDAELVNHPLMSVRGAVVCTALVRANLKLGGMAHTRRKALCDCAGKHGLVLDSIKVVDPPAFVQGHQGIWQWGGETPARERGWFHG